MAHRKIELDQMRVPALVILFVALAAFTAGFLWSSRAARVHIFLDWKPRFWKIQPPGR